MPVGTGRDERQIAFLKVPPAGEGASKPGLVWLGGFKSDMRSTKASALIAWAEARGRAALALDYSGHGESGGSFEKGTIGRWFEEALAVFRAETKGPQIVLGSSMGGWIALLLARALASAGETKRLHGLILIAPAVDFSQYMWEGFSADVRHTIETEGKCHLLLGGTIRTHAPVHILQGMRDSDVPWRRATLLIEHLAGDPAVLTLVKDGDHRLSREEDLQRLFAAIEAMD
jgi:pimeloyl-ACP methyl ester carboxylesterase